jgi:hypothetical protein
MFGCFRVGLGWLGNCGLYDMFGVLVHITGCLRDAIGAGGMVERGISLGWATAIILFNGLSRKQDIIHRVENASEAKRKKRKGLHLQSWYFFFGPPVPNATARPPPLANARAASTPTEYLASKLSSSSSCGANQEISYLFFVNCVHDHEINDI